MKRLTTYLNEKLIINRNYNLYTCVPKSFDELRQIIEDRYDTLGPGTEQKPIDFNDVDVSEMTTFLNKSKSNNKGVFQHTKFEYIDVSKWNVSNVEQMKSIFEKCINLKSVGDLSDWDVSSVEDLSFMFYDCVRLKYVGDLSNWNVSKVEKMNGMLAYCRRLKSVGDLSNWNVSKVENMNGMFKNCNLLKSIGDLSKWNVSNVNDMYGMFYLCEKLKSVGNLSTWDISNVKLMQYMFKNSGITNTPDWYKG